MGRLGKFLTGFTSLFLFLIGGILLLPTIFFMAVDTGRGELSGMIHTTSIVYGVLSLIHLVPGIFGLSFASKRKGAVLCFITGAISFICLLSLTLPIDFLHIQSFEIFLKLDSFYKGPYLFLPSLCLVLFYLIGCVLNFRAASAEDEEEITEEATPVKENTPADENIADKENAPAEEKIMAEEKTPVEKMMAEEKTMIAEASAVEKPTAAEESIDEQIAKAEAAFQAENTDFSSSVLLEDDDPVFAADLSEIPLSELEKLLKTEDLSDSAEEVHAFHQDTMAEAAMAQENSDRGKSSF